MKTLQVAQLLADTEAEGPGHRFAIWVQGCPLRCPGCCNPLMLPERGGTSYEPNVLADQVLAAPVEGVTILGGEPFAQPEAMGEVLRLVRAGGKSTMVFSGFTLAELRGRDDATSSALDACDLLVDGPYERERPEKRRRWIGSSNQVMHFLSLRYSPTDPQFLAPNTAEIRFSGGLLHVNGWPGIALPLKARR